MYQICGWFDNNYDSIYLICEVIFSTLPDASVNSKFADFLLLTDVCQQHNYRIFAIDRRLSAATP